MVHVKQYVLRTLRAHLYKVIPKHVSSVSFSISLKLQLRWENNIFVEHHIVEFW